MKIVVLDGFTTNPGDLSWDWLYRLGEVTVYERTPFDKILERARGAEILITNKTPLNREILKRLPALKYVALLSTGYNIIDGAAAKERGILVSNIPEYSTGAVAQMVFAFLLHFYNQISLHNKAVHDGAWENSRDFCFWNAPLTELGGKTIGIVGYGKIGRQVAKIALAFDMKVLAYSRSAVVGSIADHGVRIASLEELLAQSDIVTLHCPLTQETRGLINRKALMTMKETALLINTSRGPVVDEEALAGALNEGRLAGAFLDVLAKEPPDADNLLLHAKNCVITPHIAWAGLETRQRLFKIAEKNIISYLEGAPQNLVQF